MAPVVAPLSGARLYFQSLFGTWVELMAGFAPSWALTVQQALLICRKQPGQPTRASPPPGPLHTSSELSVSLGSSLGERRRKPACC